MKTIIQFIILSALSACSGHNANIQDEKKEAGRLEITWDASLFVEKSPKDIDGGGSFMLFKILIKNNSPDTFILFDQNLKKDTPRKNRFQNYFFIKYTAEIEADTVALYDHSGELRYMYTVIKPKDSLYIFPYNYTYIHQKEKGGNLMEDIKNLFAQGEMYYHPDVDYNMKSKFPPHYKLLDSPLIIPKSKNYRYAFELLDEYTDTDWFSGFNMELSFMARCLYHAKGRIKFESEKRKYDSLSRHHVIID